MSDTLQTNNGKKLQIVKTGYAEVQGESNARGFHELQGAYDEDSIREIFDSVDGKAKDLPVSVPSPFAILDLPRAAFKNVCTYLMCIINNQAKPDSGFVVACQEDFRLVRHVLDMAELCVECPEKVNFIEIKQENIDELLDEKNENTRHKNLGKTLETFKQMDKKFGFIEKGKKFKIYLVEYGENVENEGFKGKVIGGFSKETMFFVTRNQEDLENITITNSEGNRRKLFSNNIENYTHDYTEESSGNNKPFLKEIMEDFNCRSKKFKDWIVNFLHGNRKIPIGQYIDTLNRLLDDDKKIKINDEFKPEIKSNDGSISIIIDLYGECVKVEKIEDEEHGKLLNLKINELKYKINELYIGEVNAYVKDRLLEKLLNYRSMSIIKEKLDDLYELESIKDIFEDYIIRIPFKSSGNFNVLELSNETYLYPIKKGRSFSEISCKEGSNGSIWVEIDGLKKCYFENGSPTVENGVIIEKCFTLQLFPFIEKAAEYRTILIEDFDFNKEIDKKGDINFNIFFDEEDKNNIFETYKDSKPQTYYLKSIDTDLKMINLKVTYYEKEFNVCIPIDFKSKKSQQAENGEFSFAVDFGTTNTHIEYIIGDFDKKSVSPDKFKEFSLNEHIASLLDLSELERIKSNPKVKNHESLDLLTSPYILNEFLPTKELSKKYFPFRTLLLRNGDEEGYYMGKYTIPFHITSTRPIRSTFSNFKWEDLRGKRSTEDTAELYKYFLNEILFILYSKVLLSGKNPEKTKICYSYPLAFGDKINKFDEEWKELYKEIFLKKEHSNDNKDKIANENVKKIPESIAPLKFFLETTTDITIDPNEPTLCIDIGGGSTDSAVVTRNKDDIEIVFHTSYKFAGNDIFGGTLQNRNDDSYNFLTKKYFDLYGYKINDDKGKIVQNEKTGFLYKKDKNGNSYADYGDKLNQLKELELINASAEINSYLFSLADLPKISESIPHLNYMKDLKSDEKIRIVFLYFFSIIIYNLIKMLKDVWKLTADGEGKVPFIKNFVFSGNGSKIIGILDNTKGYSNLRLIIKYILEYVYGREMNEQEEKKLKIYFYPEKTKVLTAKGCLISSLTSSDSNGNELETLNSVAKMLYAKNDAKKEKGNIDDAKEGIKGFNNFFESILEQKNIDELFELPKGQKEKFKKLLEDFPIGELTNDEDKLVQLSFNPFYYFILRLFKEFA